MKVDMLLNEETKPKAVYNLLSCNVVVCLPSLSFVASEITYYFNSVFNSFHADVLISNTRETNEQWLTEPFFHCLYPHLSKFKICISTLVPQDLTRPLSIYSHVKSDYVSFSKIFYKWSICVAVFALGVSQLFHNKGYLHFTKQ